jgi:hypothetical protein
VGSIPLDRRSPEAAQAGLDLADAMLSGPGKMISIFPHPGLLAPTLLISK